MNLFDTVFFHEKKIPKTIDVQWCILSQIMSNSNTLDFERYFIIEETCTNQYTVFEILGSTQLKVQRWQCSLSNPDTSSKILFRVVMLGRQSRVEC